MVLSSYPQVVGGSYLLVGDLDLSVQLVHWRATDNSLILIGNDSSQATGVAAVGAVVWMQVFEYTYARMHIVRI